MSYITREPVCLGPPSPAIEVPNTRIAVFANTVDPDEIAHNETESTVFAFYSLKFEPKNFLELANVILSSGFLKLF